MMNLISVLVFLVSVSSIDSKFHKVFDESEDGVRKVYLYRHVGDSDVVSCSASYNNTFLKTGCVLSVQKTSDYSGCVPSYINVVTNVRLWFLGRKGTKIVQ